LFTVIVALAVSHWVQMRKVRQAQAQLKAALSEVASVRKQFGHLEIGDPKLIYVGWIESRSNSLRVQIPPGHRFLMHVTEMGFPLAGWPENPEPTTSMSMNSWSEGADVFLQWRFLREGKNRRFIVKTDSEQLFDYTMENWAEGPLPNSSARIVHSREPQKSFQPHETIPLMLFKNESTGRGVMLWMEPLRKRYPAHP
jgi:hypothetical protein